VHGDSATITVSSAVTPPPTTGTYAIPTEAPAYLVNPSATGVDALEAFVKTSGVSFANPGLNNLDSGWTATTVNPTFAAEYGPLSGNLSENLNIAVGAQDVAVDIYAFTGCTTLPTTACSSANLTDAYQVTFSNGFYTGYTALSGDPVTDLAAENALAPAVLTTINISTPTSMTVGGATQTLTASGLDQYSSSIATTPVWSSSDATVATVDSSSGVVTAVGAGSVVITATDGSVHGDSATFTVAPAPAANLVLTAPSSAIITQSTLLGETSGVATSNSAVSAAVTGLTPIAVELKNTGNATSANVLIAPVNAGSHIQLWAKDTSNNWYDISVTGWIAAPGVAVPAGYDATTNVYAISDLAGSYPLTVNLVNAVGGATVASTTGTLTVNANLSTLTADISAANALLPVTEGTVPGNYVVGSSATLTSAITAAGLITVKDDQSVVDAADATLNAAVATFKLAIVPAVQGGGGGQIISSGGGGSSYVAPVVTTPTPVVTTPAPVGQVLGASTGPIAGCDARTTGFSTTTGQSCVGNTGATGQVLGAQSYNFTLTLRMGSKGTEVTELQTFLNNAGYNCGTADGKFGAKTKAAVIKFEIANKLIGDGVVGAKVRALLNA
jgi:uncharacterized protein YjdB